MYVRQSGAEETMFNMPDDCRYSSDLDQNAALNMTRDTDVVLEMYCPHCQHLLR